MAITFIYLESFFFSERFCANELVCLINNWLFVPISSNWYLTLALVMNYQQGGSVNLFCM